MKVHKRLTKLVMVITMIVREARSEVRVRSKSMAMRVVESYEICRSEWLCRREI